MFPMVELKRLPQQQEGEEGEEEEEERAKKDISRVVVSAASNSSKYIMSGKYGMGAVRAGKHSDEQEIGNVPPFYFRLKKS